MLIFELMKQKKRKTKINCYFMVKFKCTHLIFLLYEGVVFFLCYFSVYFIKLNYYIINVYTCMFIDISMQKIERSEYVTCKAFSCALYS